MANISLLLDESVHEKFWNVANECLSHYDNYGDDIEGFVSDKLGDLADAGEVSEFSTEGNTVFSSPGYDAGYVSVAWVDKDGRLGHIVFNWAVS